jgi:hypothetical protein
MAGFHDAIWIVPDSQGNRTPNRTHVLNSFRRTPQTSLEEIQ